MRKFSVTSLTAHIWSIFIGLIFVVFLCLFLFHTIFYEQFYDSFKRSQLIATSEQIKSLINSEEDFNNELEVLIMNENLQLAIYTINNNQVETYYNTTSVTNLKLVAEMLLESTNSYEFFRDEPVSSASIFVYITKISLQGNECFLYVNSPIEGSNIAYTINQYQILISAAITILFGIALSFAFSRYLSKPIRDLNDAAFLLGNGNYEVEFPNQGFDEIRELSISLNKARDELMKTNKLQQEFIANVSHDLRTPLTVIKSYAEMINDFSGDNKEKREEHLQVIIGETNRLSSLVTDVLEMTKLSANKTNLNIENINITKLVIQVLEKLKLPILDNKIKLTSNIEKNIFSNIDEGAFNQVIYNFLLNAITYTKDQITVSLCQLNNKIIFSVVDNGIGIKEEEINNIWERYYRSNENHERHKHGSGLGLSIVKNILDNHNFEYGVKSIYGEGSRFYVILPYIKEFE